MEDQIPSSFKVQWINTTLKFLKNDNQLVMEYPEMPVQHMEYLHNLIWQRRNDVGLGFKSMYAPVWEAMRIFSLKYKFKVLVNKSVDGLKGRLVIEKIPKNEQDKTEQEGNQGSAKVNSSELIKQVEDSQSSDSEDSSQPDSPAQNSITTQLKKTTKTKPKKKKKKSEKFVIDKQKIIESISPVLLRKALQKILDFLLKQEEASIIFSDLAPVEAKFLENFLGIYNKRQSFQSILSPACNELMEKMCEFFKEFDKQCKLEVYAAKYNVNTKKREVTFMKVPRYTRSNAKLPPATFVTPQTKTENIQSVSPFIKGKEKSQKPISSLTVTNSNLKITLTNENTTKYVAIEKREVKLSLNAENRDNKSTNNVTNTDYLNHRENEEVNSNKNNTYYNATEKIYDKEVKLSMNAGTKDDKVTEKIEKNDMIEEQKRSENKDHLKQDIKETNLPIDTIKRTLPETKIEKPTASNNKLRDGYLGPRKEKLLTAMSTPLESDKAIRMMRLMGWEGGALGLRGHGIVEPIIPALDIIPGKGLGHVAEKPKPVKSVKPVKEPPAKEGSRTNKAVKISKSTRVENRTVLLKAILEIISTDVAGSVVNYPTQLATREKKCYEAIIQTLNDRNCLTLTDSEIPILMIIQKIMKEKPDLFLEMVFAADFRDLTITKLNGKQTHLTKMAEPKKNSKGDILKINSQMSKKDFRLFICLAVLELLESDNTEKSIDFDGTLTVKHFKMAETLCTFINRRSKVPFPYMKELFAKILDNTKECYLEVQMKDEPPIRSILLRKVYYRKPYVNNEVLKNIINKYTNTKIPDANSQIDYVNVHKDEESIKTNNSYFKEANKTNTEIKENINKTNECNDLNYDIKLHDHIIVNNSNEVRGKNLKENLVGFPSYVKNMYTADHNDFRRMNMNLLQDTINSLTLHDKTLEENKLKLHNSEIITSNLENQNSYINDNSKYNESSKQSDKPDGCCQITKNIRKWYAHSEKFLCDDLVKSTPVKNIDSNNNRNQVTLEVSEDFGQKLTTTEIAENNDSQINNDKESDKPNQNDDTHTKLEQKDQDLEEVISEYTGCDAIKDSMDEFKSNESHHSVEKHLECFIIQKEANNGDDLKPIPEVDVRSDNQNSFNMIESENSYHENKKHVIRIDSEKLTKQVSEVCNDFKDMIDSGISYQTENHSESDIIPVGEDRGEDLNAISVNGVRTNITEDSVNMIELKKMDQVNEKLSEIDLIQLETHNEEVLNDYGTDESNRTNCDVIREKIQNEETSKDYSEEYSHKCTKTDEKSSKLDIITVELDYKQELTLGPKESQQTDINNSQLNAKQIEANNTIDLALTNEFEINESNESPKEGEIHSELEVTKIKTDYNANVNRDQGELDQSYESFEVKHNMFDIDKLINDIIEDLKHSIKSRKDGLDESNKTDKINSKLDTIQVETDHTKKSKPRSEPQTKKPEDSHRKEVNPELNIKETPEDSHRKEVYPELNIIETPENSHRKEVNSELNIIETPEDSQRKEVNSELNIIQVEEELKEKSTTSESEENRKEVNSESDLIKGGQGYEENLTLLSVFEKENPENSHRKEEINSKLDTSQCGTDYKENLTLTSKLEVKFYEKVNPDLDEFKVKSDNINSTHVNGNEIKELSNVRREIVKNFHDIVLIKSNILGIEAIQKKIQSLIENMASENLQVIRPLLKYHGVLDNSIVYSCYNKDTCLWLKNVLTGHDVIDYRGAIDNHKLKIKVTSSNKDAKKVLELLEVYNRGLKCHEWKIIYENHYFSSLIIGVEVDSSSFEYICDNNFSLCVGYDFAQFSIAY